MKERERLSHRSHLHVTLPLFNSSNDVGISENSLGAPYRLIQQGPNVGRKPRNIHINEEEKNQ